MLWHIAEWADTLLVAGLVVLAAGAAMWWLSRRVRRLEGVTGMVMRYALQSAADGAAVGGGGCRRG